MAPVLRPGDRPFTAGGRPPGPPAGPPVAPVPPGGGLAPPMGGRPPGPAAGPGGPPAPPAAPTPDPAEIQRQSMLALLEQAQPVPDTVQRYPGDLDTSPHPYFPADSDTRRGRRDPY